jgi:predicted lipid-binding transport protein (Tim44 family)
MSSAMDPLNLILLAVAAVVVWRLWSVLGTRTGFEKPPIVLQPKAETPVTSPQPDAKDPEPSAPAADAPVWQGYAEADSDLAKGLEAIAAKSRGFDVAGFLRGATIAYEMVLEAFAKADKPTLKNLLSKDLMDSFVAAIDARAAKAQSTTFQFVGIKQASLSRAVLSGNKAQIDVSFTADMISATQDSAGTVLEGDDKAIRTVQDLWTFERDVTARDPNWKLVETEDNS